MTEQVHERGVRVISQHRVPVAPYQALHPDRPVAWVLADHTATVFIRFTDGATISHPKIGEPQ